MHIVPKLLSKSVYFSIESKYDIKRKNFFKNLMTTVKAQDFEQAAAQMQQFALEQQKNVYWLFGKIVAASLENNAPNHERDCFILELVNSFPKEQQPNLLKQALYKLPDQKHSEFLRTSQLPENATLIAPGGTDILDQRISLRMSLNSCSTLSQHAPILAVDKGTHLAYLIKKAKPPLQSEQDYFFDSLPHIAQSMNPMLAQRVLQLVERRVNQDVWKLNFTQLSLLFANLPPALLAASKIGVQNPEFLFKCVSDEEVLKKCDYNKEYSQLLATSLIQDAASGGQSLYRFLNSFADLEKRKGMRFFSKAFAKSFGKLDEETAKNVIEELIARVKLDEGYMATLLKTIAKTACLSPKTKQNLSKRLQDLGQSVEGIFVYLDEIPKKEIATTIQMLCLHTDERLQDLASFFTEHHKGRELPKFVNTWIEAIARSEINEDEKKRIINTFLSHVDQPTRLKTYMTLKSSLPNSLLADNYQLEVAMLELEIAFEIERFVSVIRQTGTVQPFRWTGATAVHEKIEAALERIFIGPFENEVLAILLLALDNSQFKTCATALAKAFNVSPFEACLPLIHIILQSPRKASREWFYYKIDWLLEEGLAKDPLADGKRVAFLNEVPLHDWEDFVDNMYCRDIVRMAMKQRHFYRISQAIDYFIIHPPSKSKTDFAGSILMFCEKETVLGQEFVKGLSSKAKTWLALQQPKLIPLFIHDANKWLVELKQDNQTDSSKRQTLAKQIAFHANLPIEENQFDALWIALAQGHDEDVKLILKKLSMNGVELISSVHDQNPSFVPLLFPYVKDDFTSAVLDDQEKWAPLAVSIMLAAVELTNEKKRTAVWTALSESLWLRGFLKRVLPLVLPHLTAPTALSMLSEIYYYTQPKPKKFFSIMKRIVPHDTVGEWWGHYIGRSHQGGRDHKFINDFFREDCYGSAEDKELVFSGLCAGGPMGVAAMLLSSQSIYRRFIAWINLHPEKEVELFSTSLLACMRHENWEVVARSFELLNTISANITTSNHHAFFRLMETFWTEPEKITFAERAKADFLVGNYVHMPLLQWFCPEWRQLLLQRFDTELQKAEGESDYRFLKINSFITRVPNKEEFFQELRRDSRLFERVTGFIKQYKEDLFSEKYANAILLYKEYYPEWEAGLTSFLAEFLRTNSKADANSQMQKTIECLKTAGLFDLYKKYLESPRCQQDITQILSFIKL